MINEIEYKVGYFVNYYDGIKNTFAKIKEIYTYSDCKMYRIVTIDTKSEIECLENKISIILTENKHLEKIGFIEVIKKDRHYYRLNSLIITNKSFKFLDRDHIFISGFCFGDLNEILIGSNIESYIVNGELNRVLVNMKYPSLYNVNQLIRFAEENKILNFEKEELILC